MSTDRIPIQNIYFLLCYAWKHLQEAQYAEVRSKDCEKVWDLLAKVLIKSSQQLIKRGLHRNYILRQEQLVRPKGKILMTEEIRRPTYGRPLKVCEFDELSPNTLPNQIISSAFYILQRHQGLNSTIQKELREVAPFWESFGRPKITPQTFRRMSIHRNMRHYRFALSICELIHKLFLPGEGSGPAFFRDFLRDEATMHELFEQFVRNFLAMEQSTYKVSASHVKWVIDGDRSSARGISLLPTMRTDVFLESPEDRLIIDCKYYQDAFQKVYETPKFKSDHLYQLFAYVKNQAVQPGWENGRGILLYPTMNEHFDEHITIHGHELRLISINLNQNWEALSSNLLGLLKLKDTDN